MEESIQEESEPCLDEDVGSFTIWNEDVELFCCKCIEKGLYGYMGVST